MLKNGYWLTEYLSILRVIYRSKTKYEKAYLYAEAGWMVGGDINDAGGLRQSHNAAFVYRQ